MKKNKISKNWINRQKKDIYVRQSKIDGYRSRAVYKLIEIDKKFQVLKNGFSVVDLGASPGSWSQYASKNFKNITILSVDIKEMILIKNVEQIIGDFTEKKNQIKIKNYFNKKIEVVLSDMAENTTGNKNLDSISTGELCKKAMLFSTDILNLKGIFVSKIFMGSTFNEIIDLAKKKFIHVNVFKPSSSRKDSKESFIICKFLR